MRPLIYKIILALFLLFFLDRSIGYFFDIILSRSPDGRYYKTSYTLNSCDEEIVIIGSSRGETNISPIILTKELGIRSWNASRGGQGLPYFRCIQEGILKRYKPKILILNIESYLLEAKPHYEKLGFLRPYYWKNKEIRPMINKISKFERFLITSKLYSYNSSFYYLFRPFFIHGIDGKISDNGWKPLQGKMNRRIIEELGDFDYKESIDSLNRETVSIFDTLINKFVNTDTKLIIVTSPDFYNKGIVTSPTIRYIEETCNIHQIPYFNFANDTSITSNSQYFHDPDHLNKTGAIYFSNKLCNKIKAYVNN